MLELAMAAGVAWACGGTVCDGTSTTTTIGGTTTTTTTTTTTGTSGAAGAGGGGPIVQSGERIVFLQERDEWTAFVQIQTQGASNKFGWVIPLPESIDPAEVTVAPDGLMDDLEQATAPRFLTDDGTLSGAAEETAGGCDCSGALLDELLVDAAQLAGSAVVGPYELTMLGGDDLEGLAAWFLQGGYDLPFSTWPLIDGYVARGYSFLAVRMLPFPGGGQGTVQTLRIPCGQNKPTIPLELTSIAAVTDMSITTYVLADQRYVPDSEWPEVAFDPSVVTPDGAGGTDYATQVRAALDGSTGRGWRTEFAGPAADIIGELDRDNARELGSGAYLTRLQTWVSPEEMLSDPMFVPAPADSPDVDNVIDLRTSRAAMLGGALAPLLLGITGVLRRRRA
jgi:hypothetical protein